MKFHKTLIALAVGAAAALTTLAASATEFRSADIHPDDYPTVTAVKFMSERLKALSGGKHSIKVFNNSSLGSEKDTIEQTKIGALQMVRVNIAPMNNICAETQVPTMPFLFRSVDHLHKVLDGPIGEEILKSCEKQGFIGLAYYDSGARSMFTAKKPVRSFADMKGLKVRVQQSDLWVSMLEAMGANATPMPMGEVYTGLKTGLIDAAENNYPPMKAPAPSKWPSTTARPSTRWRPRCCCSPSACGTSSPPKSKAGSAKPPRSRCPTCASNGKSAKSSRWPR